MAVRAHGAAPGRTLLSAGPPSAAPGGELAFRNKPVIAAPRWPALALSESRAVPGPDADFRQLLAGGEELTHPCSASGKRFENVLLRRLWERVKCNSLPPSWGL